MPTGSIAGPLTIMVLIPGAVALLLVGAGAGWTAARWAAVRNPDGLVRSPSGVMWEAVSTPDTVGRHWRPATPPTRALRDPWHQRVATLARRTWLALGVRRKAIRPTLAAWWASTAPRGAHSYVPAPAPRYVQPPPSWYGHRPVYIGRPPLGVSR